LTVMLVIVTMRMMVSFDVVPRNIENNPFDQL
jgi:hypothetical protein